MAEILNQGLKDQQVTEKSHLKENEKTQERHKSDLSNLQKKQKKDFASFESDLKKGNKTAKGNLEDRIKKLISQKEKANKQVLKEFQGGKPETAALKQAQKDEVDAWENEILQTFALHQDALLSDAKFAYEKKELQQFQESRLKAMEEVWW